MAALTILSDMTGAERPDAIVAQAAAWGLTTIDLKTVSGRNIAELSDPEVAELGGTLRQARMSVEAFSTGLFKLDVEAGEGAFAAHLAQLDRVLTIAGRLAPCKVRLLAAETRHRAQLEDSIAMIVAEHPWLHALYGEAVDRIHAAGFEAVIENETGGCIFSTAHEVTAFFAALGRPERVRFTWDVQNLWEMGTFPSLAVYHSLRPVIGYYHVKGGRAEPGSPALVWRSPLETASWPVVEITRAVLADRVSPVICLNPSHGRTAPGEVRTDDTLRDLTFLRSRFPAFVAMPAQPGAEPAVSAQPGAAH